MESYDSVKAEWGRRMSRPCVQAYDIIPSNKIIQFGEIINQCGGKYRCKPERIGDNYHVYFEYWESSKYSEHCEAWRRVTRDFKEVRKDQWWRKLLRRFFR